MELIKRITDHENIAVLVVITTSFVKYGGLTNAYMNYYRAMDKTGLEIDIASTNNPEAELIAELEKNGSTYFNLGDRKKDVFGYIRRLNEVLLNKHYDVIHVNANSATAVIELAIAKKRGVTKRIAHNHTSICDHKIAHYVLKPFFDKCYTDALACSRRAGEWIFTDGHFIVMNNGILAEKYRFSKEDRNAIREKYGINESTFVIGNLGKIYKPKNHAFLIDVFNEYHKKNQDSILLLVGDGVLRHEIENKVKTLRIDDSVIFAGMQDQPQKYLSAMDYFIFPSIWEGMPLALIEAQASGLECLASDSIDSDVAVTDNVRFLDVLSSANIWSTNVECANEDRNDTSDKAIHNVMLAGYDVATSSLEMRNLYIESRGK